MKMQNTRKRFLVIDTCCRLIAWRCFALDRPMAFLDWFPLTTVAELAVPVTDCIPFAPSRSLCEDAPVEVWVRLLDNLPSSLTTSVMDKDTQDPTDFEDRSAVSSLCEDTEVSAVMTLRLTDLSPIDLSAVVALS